MTDDPSAIAMEHIFWARDQRMTPTDVLLSVGSVLPAFRDATWEDVDMVLQIVWRRCAERIAQREAGQADLFGNVVPMRRAG